MLDLSNRKTKIVATIGPASESEEKIKEIIEAGMNIARFNTKHNVPEWHVERMRRIKKVAKELGADIKVLLDLQGPEVRVNVLNTDSFEVKKGDKIFFTSEMETTEPNAVNIPADVITSLNIGNQISMQDGASEFVITEKSETTLRAEAVYDCKVSTRKTFNTPGVVLNMPSLLPKDIEYIDAATEEGLVDYIGLSFVRNAKDIEILRAELDKRNMKSQIVGKIENQAAIDNLDEIIAASDAIMVARGDLAVEVPFYEVPRHQKIIIKKCNEAKKFVITATQMLLSMMENPRPTRAETSDIANAVYDGTDAVMLSEESAMGKWAVRAVQTQAMIVAYHEKFV